MAERAPSVPFEEALRALVAWLEATRVTGVIIGGVAASLLGRPRMTRDVDVLVRIPDQQLAQFATAGAGFGILPRLSGALDFARRRRVLLLRHQPTGVDLDVVLSGLPFEHEVIARRRTKRLKRMALPLARAEDLIVLKALAHRPRDLDDIEGLLKANPRLDLARVRKCAAEFADALERPDLLRDLEKILRRAKPPRSGK